MDVKQKFIEAIADYIERDGSVSIDTDGIIDLGDGVFLDEQDVIDCISQAADLVNARHSK